MAQLHGFWVLGRHPPRSAGPAPVVAVCHPRMGNEQWSESANEARLDWPSQLRSAWTPGRPEPAAAGASCAEPRWRPGEPCQARQTSAAPCCQASASLVVKPRSMNILFYSGPGLSPNSPADAHPGLPISPAIDFSFFFFFCFFLFLFPFLPFCLLRLRNCAQAEVINRVSTWELPSSRGQRSQSSLTSLRHFHASPLLPPSVAGRLSSEQHQGTDSDNHHYCIHRRRGKIISCCSQC